MKNSGSSVHAIIGNCFCFPIFTATSVFISPWWFLYCPPFGYPLWNTSLSSTLVTVIINGASVHSSVWWVSVFLFWPGFFPVLCSFVSDSTFYEDYCQIAAFMWQKVALWLVTRSKGNVLSEQVLNIWKAIFRITQDSSLGRGGEAKDRKIAVASPDPFAQPFLQCSLFSTKVREVG